MGLFENFPYTNFQQMNLDWLLRKIKEMANVVDNITDTISDTINSILTEMGDDGTLAELIRQNAWYTNKKSLHMEIVQVLHRTISLIF